MKDKTVVIITIVLLVIFLANCAFCGGCGCGGNGDDGTCENAGCSAPATTTFGGRLKLCLKHYIEWSARARE